MIIPSPLPCSYGSHRCLHIQEEEEERTKTFLRRSPSLIGGTSRGGVPQQPASQPASRTPDCNERRMEGAATPWVVRQVGAPCHQLVMHQEPYNYTFTTDPKQQQLQHQLA